MASDDSTQSDRPRRQRATPREAATRIVQELVDAGFTAYFAGGCVRDRLMGRDPKDYDVATSARPEQVVNSFHNTQSVGEHFGVMLVRLLGRTIEVATFRTDGAYVDGRRPGEVTFTDAEHDALRRDFTINGLFEDPLNGRIIDFVGGRQDIEDRVIRAIGDPDRRIGEDRLRMLRAVRFASQFAFAIEPDTANAIRRHAEDLRGVSRERIGHEVRRMLSDPNRAVAGWELQYLGLDQVVLGEPHMTVAPTRLGRLMDDAAYPTALAAWLLDRHLADDGDVTAIDTREIAHRWASALMLSNDERAALLHTLDCYSLLVWEWEAMGVARQKRLAGRDHFAPALQIVHATDRARFIDIRRRVSELAKTGIAPEPLVSGDDLIAAGMEPGPKFRQILDAVYDAQLEGRICTREEGIDLARAVETMFRPGSPP